MPRLPTLALAALAVAATAASAGAPTPTPLPRALPPYSTAHFPVVGRDALHPSLRRLLEEAGHRARGAATPPSPAPFCQPTDPCWPPPAAWAELNASVGGRLLTVAPPAAPCFADPSGAACAAVVGGFTDPVWRSDQPGAMQAPNWEAGADGRGCNDPAAPWGCAQGDVPPVGVAAEEPAHVSAALAFAAAHNLRVVVKASGHEYQGRSTAPGALLVWLRGLTGIQVEPSRPPQCPGDAPGPAVTTRPGDGWGAVYDAVDAAGFAVVGGSARTVSSAGGWLLGGGHGFMSPAAGLGVDNLLAADVVLPNGTVVEGVSPCAHADLFWALRGGGPGLAVVTAATYRLHPPAPPGGVMGLTFVLGLLQGGPSLELFLDAFLNATAGWAAPGGAGGWGGVWAGYWYTLPAQSAFVASLVFNGSAAPAGASLAPMSAFLAGHPDHFDVVNASLAPFPSFRAWHDAIDPPATGDRTGAPVTLGSRLVPLDFCANATLRPAAVAALAAVNGYGVGLSGMMVAGGAVAAGDPGGAATAVTPAWRAAGQHVALGLGWALNATADTQAAVFGAVSNLTAILRALLPGSGAYMNEADFLEPAWEDAFWGGAHYARLAASKAALDPAGALGCHHCVQAPSPAGGGAAARRGAA